MCSPSSTRHEGDHHVGGVLVEVLPSVVVHRRRPRVGVAGSDLDLAERDPGVERAHDEPGPQHVGMDVAKSGPLGDRADPAVGGAPVQALAIASQQDRAGAALADGQVDGPGGARHERDDGRLVALADDAECAVAPLEAQVLDVGGARLAHPQAVQPEQDGQGGMGVVEALGGEDQRSQLGAVQAPGVTRVDFWAAHVLGRMAAMRPSMWANR